MIETRSAIDSGRLLLLLREMVDCYSPSGKEEELAEQLEATIAARGLAVVRQPVDDSRFNLLVSGNGCTAAETLFLGHIDTVPALDIDRYDYEERDGLCHGLGTADMKGGCAAMIEAFTAAVSSGRLPDGVLLALVVGEEENGDGTRVLLEQGRFRQALVGEPTDLKPCLDHYGYIEMNIRAFGDRRHAALSGRETNAIRALLRFLLKFEERVEADGRDIVLNIRDLHSSESGFAVPDRCAAGIDLHLPPAMAARAYRPLLQTFAERELEACGASRMELDFPTVTDGFRTDPGDPLPLRLAEVFEARGAPWAPEAFKSHSDANLLRDAGCRPVILGPGQLAKAHTRDESVLSSQVVTAAELYAGLLDALFSFPIVPAP